VLLVLSSVLLLGCSSGPEDQAELLVKLKAGTSPSTRTELFARVGASPVDILEAIEVHKVSVEADKVDQAMAALQEDPNVEIAEVIGGLEPAYTPDDTTFPAQWGMAKINAPAAWDVTKSDASVRIAILDTGVDLDHEDLQAKIVASENFTFSVLGPNDIEGHGTHVAGTAAAVTDNAKGVAGVGFNASILNAKVVDDQGFAFSFQVAQGIDWAVANGADVIKY
jgi:thermitase